MEAEVKGDQTAARQYFEMYQTLKNKTQLENTPHPSKKRNHSPVIDLEGGEKTPGFPTNKLKDKSD
jgi:hypothetical protein